MLVCVCVYTEKMITSEQKNPQPSRIISMGTMAKLLERSDHRGQPTSF